MNKFQKGQKIFYFLMDSTCQSKVVDFYIKDGQVYYVDALFNNIKECYVFVSKRECVEYHNKKWST
jgi:hypothetical protein